LCTFHLTLLDYPIHICKECNLTILSFPQHKAKQTLPSLCLANLILSNSEIKHLCEGSSGLVEVLIKSSLHSLSVGLLVGRSLGDHYQSQSARILKSDWKPLTSIGKSISVCLQSSNVGLNKAGDTVGGKLALLGDDSINRGFDVRLSGGD